MLNTCTDSIKFLGLKENNECRIKICTIKLSNVYLNKNQTHFFRGYIGNLFKQYDIIHNHDILTGKEMYRYPLIQFKVLDQIPHIIAFGENAISVQQNILRELEKINIKGVEIAVLEKKLELNESNFGCSDSVYTYNFLTPWIGLNQKNYEIYKTLSNILQKEFLKKCLIGNLMSVSKGFNYTVKEQIKVEINLNANNVILKGRNMIGFTGYFKVNFDLPDYLGLGKSVSRGYGCVKKII